MTTVRIAAGGAIAVLALVAAPSAAQASRLETAACVASVRQAPTTPAQATTPWLIHDDEQGRWSGGYAWGFSPDSSVDLLLCAFADENGNGRQDLGREKMSTLRIKTTTGEYGATPWREEVTYPASVEAGDRVCDRTTIRSRSTITGKVTWSTSKLACFTVERQVNGNPF